MCWKTICDKCKKYTWAGCGNHIESVKASVSKEQWCGCDTQNKKQ